MWSFGAQCGGVEEVKTRSLSCPRKGASMYKSSFPKLCKCVSICFQSLKFFCLQTPRVASLRLPFHQMRQTLMTLSTGENPKITLLKVSLALGIDIISRLAPSATDLSLRNSQEENKPSFGHYHESDARASVLDGAVILPRKLPKILWMNAVTWYLSNGFKMFQDFLHSLCPYPSSMVFFRTASSDPMRTTPLRLLSQLLSALQDTPGQRGRQLEAGQLGQMPLRPAPQPHSSSAGEFFWESVVFIGWLVYKLQLFG